MRTPRTQLATGDEVWRKLFQTSDFRRALSVAINREDINQAIFYGLGVLNMLLLAAMFMLEGRLMLLPSIFGLLSLVLGLVFTSTRINGMRAFHADGSNGGNGNGHELRAARA